jgi:hypothetical protein
MMKKLLLFFILLQFSLLGNVAVYTSAQKGFVYNMPISGLYYETSNGFNCTPRSGITDVYGSFDLDTTCGTYTFYLDSNKKIGLTSITTTEIQKLSPLHGGKNIIFLTNLVGAESDDSSDTNAIKLTQLFMGFDNDMNPNNGIELNTSNLVSNNLQDNISFYNTTYLQNLLHEQFGTNTRKLPTTQCATAYLEYILRTNPFKQYDVDTVGPCTPQLAYNQKATSSDITYVEVLGEVGSEIYLDGVLQGKLSQRDATLYPSGIMEELKLNTTIQYNSFDSFIIALKDSKNRWSENNLTVKIFNDSDQPYFGDINTTINTSDTTLIDLNIDDSSKDNNLSLTYEINDTRFHIDEDTEVITRDANLSSGNYIFKLNVRDEAWHREEKDFNLTIP